jgi:hypothetical protein
MVALAGTGCSQMVNAGLGLLGIHRNTPANAEAPVASGKAHGASPTPEAPPPRTASIYEVMPATDWGRYAVGDPASPAFSLAHMTSSSSCLGRPWGIWRVVPLGLGGGPLNGLDTYGVTADPVTRGEDVFSGGVGMARWSMTRTARMGTYSEGCSQNVFAYVRLGGAGAWEPVVVR